MQLDAGGLSKQVEVTTETPQLGATLTLEQDLSSLDLDGALVIRAGPGVSVEVVDCVVHNEGWRMRPATEEDAALLKAINAFGSSNWELVAAVLASQRARLRADGGRPPTGCRSQGLRRVRCRARATVGPA